MIRALYNTKEPREDLAAFQGDKRLLVSLRALDGKDDELLKTMAKTFEKCGGTLTEFMYWPEEAMKAIAFNEPVIRAGGHDCCVM